MNLGICSAFNTEISWFCHAIQVPFISLEIHPKFGKATKEKICWQQTLPTLLESIFTDLRKANSACTAHSLHSSPVSPCCSSLIETIYRVMGKVSIRSAIYLRPFVPLYTTFFFFHALQLFSLTFLSKKKQLKF